MMGYAFLRDDEVERANPEELDFELGGQSHMAAEQSLAEICSWADGQQSFASSGELDGRDGRGLQSHGDHAGGFADLVHDEVHASNGDSGGGDVNATGKEGASGAAGGGEEKAAKPDWRSGARAYNAAHAGLVEQFNAATHDECGSGGEADPEKVARWQKEHGVAPDGRVGSQTFHAAKRLSTAKAAQATKEASAGGGAGASAEGGGGTATAAVKQTPVVAKPEAAPVKTESAKPEAQGGATSGGASSSSSTTAGKAEPVAQPMDPAKLQEMLRANYARILKLFTLGQVSETEAVGKLVATDKKANGGQPSAEALLMIPMLLADLAKAAMKKAQSALAAFTGGDGDGELANQGGGPKAGGGGAGAGGGASGPVNAQVGEPFAGVYTAGSGENTQKCQVYVSPGGVTATPDIFLFFHGHRAQYNIDDKQTGKGEISGLDVAADAMTHARGKNVIAILPQGKLASGRGKQSREHEGGYMPALQAGLPSFLSSVLGPLANDLHMASLTPRHISIAGHSAGGYMGVHDALAGAGNLADEITDVTLMDTGYAEVHFNDTAKWMYSGGPGKSVRIIGTAKQMEGGVHAGAFGKSALATSAKKHGCTVEHLAAGDKRDEDTKVMQHSRIMKDGAVQCDVLILQYDHFHHAGRDHAPLRDRVMDDTILSIGEGAAGSDVFGHYDKGEYDGEAEHDEHDGDHATPVKAEAPKAKAPEPKPEVKTESKPPQKSGASTDEHTKEAGKKVEETKGKAAAPKKKAKKTAYDTDGTHDSFGNLTERDTSSKGQKSTATTFSTPFTVVRDGALFDEKHKALKKALPKDTQVKVVNMKGAWVQITSSDPAATYTKEDNVWLKFTSLGGDGAARGLGNEKGDAKDKERANKIREGLPEGRNPGHSKFKWMFGDGFMPSMDGVSLSGSLMSKVNALMEWAIENDMVVGNIVIGSGMRSPAAAHYLCVRYEIANMDTNRRVTLDALKALPGGKDADGNKWYEAGWTEQQAIDNAKEKIKKSGASGKVAAAGYDLGNSKRAPLPISGRPGVSNHCSGHAVDVDIPWRSPDDPNKKDLWAWEQIYHQFGLTRPLHRDRGGKASTQESWHIEETGKDLEEEAAP